MAETKADQLLAYVVIKYNFFQFRQSLPHKNTTILNVLFFVGSLSRKRNKYPTDRQTPSPYGGGIGVSLSVGVFEQKNQKNISEKNVRTHLFITGRHGAGPDIQKKETNDDQQ